MAFFFLKKTLLSPTCSKGYRILLFEINFFLMRTPLFIIITLSLNDNSDFTSHFVGFFFLYGSVKLTLSELPKREPLGLRLKYTLKRTF